MSQAGELTPAQDAADFAAAVESESGANILRCLQCGKCSSGCPVAGLADIRPHELLRLVQLGQRDEVLASRMIWQCVSCQTCATRCPQEVDIAAMNDALRQMSQAAGRVNDRTTVPVFNRIFLKSIRKRGRTFEMGLMTSYKLRTLRLWADVAKFPMMLLKGKLPLLPTRAGRADERKAIFRRVAEAKGGRK